MLLQALDLKQVPKLVDACEYEEARNIALTWYVLPVRLGTLNSASNVT